MRQSSVVFGFVFEKLARPGREITLLSVMSSFSKSSVFKMFTVNTKTRSQFISNSSSLRSVFEKLRFRDGLMWTVGRSNHRNKAAFSNSSGVILLL